MKIKMITGYRHFHKPGDIVSVPEEQTAHKAEELVNSGRATYIEEAAPMNKEITTRKVVGKECSDCGKGFASERGLKLHRARMH